MDLEDWIPMAVTTCGSAMVIGLPPAPPPPPGSGKELLSRTEPLASPDIGVSKSEARQAEQKGELDKVQQSTKPVGLADKVSLEIWEVVASCNLAHRQGYGELVWFIYVVNKKV